MVADYPDWTDLVNIVGTDIMVAIDLQGAYIMMPVDLQAQYITLDINIAASAVTLQVNIASQTANLNINLAASAVTLQVNIASQTANLNINLAASAVTLDIVITAQDVDLNIATSSTQNIVIDKLIQDAFTARIFTLQNDNDVATPTAPPASHTGATYYGKFFPRGCRGMLESLSIYCKRTATGTLTLSYAPTPAIGAVGTVDITPGSSWDWQDADVKKMWNYDSLFVWVSDCDADVSYGLQVFIPYDEFYSADSGATWAIQSSRIFIRASVGGATVGDIPVSGTLNIVALPAISSQQSALAQPIAALTQATLVSANGAGVCDYILFHVAAATDSNDAACNIYCDGEVVYSNTFLYADLYGLGASTPGISLTKYNVDGPCCLVITKKFQFQRSFEGKVMNNSESEIIVSTIAVIDLIR